jgi:hypothetical protein
MNFQCIKEVIKRDESTTRNFSTNVINLALFTFKTKNEKNTPAKQINALRVILNII